MKERAAFQYSLKPHQDINTPQATWQLDPIIPQLLQLKSRSTLNSQSNKSKLTNLHQLSSFILPVMSQQQKCKD